MSSRARSIAWIAVLVTAGGSFPTGVASAGDATTARPTSLDSLLAAPAVVPDLLERAVLERNPTLAAAKAAAAEAKARADAAGSFMNPMLEVMAAPRAIGNEDIAAPTRRELGPYSGDTRLFISPGFKFRVVDALLTNFHLPESTLLMLVSAFAGRDKVLAAYEHAVREKYRFFSYGDAMFVTPESES